MVNPAIGVHGAVDLKPSIDAQFTGNSLPPLKEAQESAAHSPKGKEKESQGGGYFISASLTLG